MSIYVKELYCRRIRLPGFSMRDLLRMLITQKSGRRK